MKEIPTAENFLKSSQDPMKDEDRNEVYMTWQVKEAMIEFAKLHVEAALRKASDRFDHCLIPNSYPLTNIK
jgi:hypothetical protein